MRQSHAVFLAMAVWAVGCGGEETGTPEPEAPVFDDDEIGVSFINRHPSISIWIDWRRDDGLAGSVDRPFTGQTHSYKIPEGQYTFRWTYDFEVWESWSRAIIGPEGSWVVYRVGENDRPTYPIGDQQCGLSIRNISGDRFWVQYRIPNRRWYLASDYPIPVVSTTLTNIIAGMEHQVRTIRPASGDETIFSAPVEIVGAIGEVVNVEF